MFSSVMKLQRCNVNDACTVSSESESLTGIEPSVHRSDAVTTGLREPRGKPQLRHILGSCTTCVLRTGRIVDVGKRHPR